MARYTPYSPDKCDSLKRDRKNLTNKLYRRRVKLKNTPPSRTKEAESLKRDIRKIVEKVDLLNTKIWKCTETYHDLRKNQLQNKSKIRYREKQIEKFGEKSTKSKEYKTELASLRKETQELTEKVWSGSHHYKNLGMNMKRLSSKIKYQQQKFSSLKKKADQGIINPKSGKPFKFDEKQRAKAIKYIGELGEKRRMLKETINNKKFKKIDQNRVHTTDSENQTEYDEYTVFQYKDEFDLALKRRKTKNKKKVPRYKIINISGEYIGSLSFDYPSQIISIENAIMNGDKEYAPFGSKVKIGITADNKSEELSLVYILMEEEFEDDEESGE